MKEELSTQEHEEMLESITVKQDASFTAFSALFLVVDLTNEEELTKYATLYGMTLEALKKQIPAYLEFTKQN